MQQGLLFEPEVLARTELQDAIARLDFHSAMRRLEEFQSCLRNCARPRAARSETFISWLSSRGMRDGVMKTRSGRSAMAGKFGFSSATAISSSDMDLWRIPITTGRSCWDCRR